MSTEELATKPDWMSLGPTRRVATEEFRLTYQCTGQLPDSPSLVKDLWPCAKGRATDTPRLVWHRGVPASKSQRGFASKSARSARLRITIR